MIKKVSVLITARFFPPGRKDSILLVDGFYGSSEEFASSCIRVMFKLDYVSLVQGRIVIQNHSRQQKKEDELFIRSNDSIFDQLCVYCEKFFDVPK